MTTILPRQRFLYKLDRQIQGQNLDRLQSEPTLERCVGGNGKTYNILCILVTAPDIAVTCISVETTAVSGTSECATGVKDSDTRRGTSVPFRATPVVCFLQAGVVGASPSVICCLCQLRYSANGSRREHRI